MLRLSLVALTLISPILASAGPNDVTVRDLSGQQVSLDEDGTVVLFWSMIDTDAAIELAQLHELDRRGWTVLSVNTDGATRKGSVRAWLRSRGLGDIPTVVDVDSTRLGRLGGGYGDAVHLTGDDARVAASPMQSIASEEPRPVVARLRHPRRARESEDRTSPVDPLDVSRPDTEKPYDGGIPAVAPR